MDTEEIKINVRKLISAFENRTNNSDIPNFRPRAKSLGTVLPKDVIVKSNNFKTLTDIEEVLSTLETSLNNYQIYNKAKHVAFQEELFNILTSIINVDNDDPNEANRLVSKTKSLVALLNNKLPANNVVGDNYKSHSIRQQKTKLEDINMVSTYPKTDQNKKDNVKSVDEGDSPLQEIIPSVSVRKLKEKFQSVEDITKVQTKITRTQSLYTKQHYRKPERSDLKSRNQFKEIVEEPKIVQSIISQEKTEHQTVTPSLEESKIQLSVTNLRNMFEVKSKESSIGLPVIFKQERPPVTRFNYRNDADVNKEPQLVIQTKDTYQGSSRLLTILERDKENYNQKNDYRTRMDEITEEVVYNKNVNEPNEEENKSSSFAAIGTEDAYKKIGRVPLILKKDNEDFNTKLNKESSVNEEHEDGYKVDGLDEKNGEEKFQFKLNISKEDELGNVISVNSKYDLRDEIAVDELNEEETESSIFTAIRTKETHEETGKVSLISKKENEDFDTKLDVNEERKDEYIVDEFDEENGEEKFQFELNISKEDDLGNVVSVNSKYDLRDSKFDKMASLEFIEEDGSNSLFEEDSLSESSVESVRFIQAVKLDEVEKVNGKSNFDGKYKVGAGDTGSE